MAKVVVHNTYLTYSIAKACLEKHTYWTGNCYDYVPSLLLYRVAGMSKCLVGTILCGGFNLPLPHPPRVDVKYAKKW